MGPLPGWRLTAMDFHRSMLTEFTAEDAESAEWEFCSW
jgi:hypothetical protein